MTASREIPFEALFAERAGSVPVPFLRALALHESGFNPQIVNPKSHATGLFQITATALESYNARNRTAHVLADLTDPTLSTEVAVDHIGRILAVYAEHPSLKTDWTSRRFVELLVFGWNAGHNGVAWLAGKLEARRGISPDRITVDTVRQLAGQISNSPYLSSGSRVVWAKAVTRTYFGDEPLPGGPSLVSMAATGAFVLGLISLGVGAALADRGRA